MKKNTKNVYDMVTERILEQLEQGIIPWHKPWTGTAGAWSRSTGRAYSLLNQWWLPAGEYATFKQIQEAGGKVKKGEKGHQVVFWKLQKIEEEVDGEKALKTIPILRYYTVFNINQCEGIEQKYHKDEVENHNEPIAELEAIKNDYLKRSGVKLAHKKQDRAYYQPAFDGIVLPLVEQFDSIEEYYSTAFHEMAHSTGHESRLNRLNTLAAKGSNDYGKEELVAEITAAAVLNEAGIETAKTLKNSAAYIQSWRDAIRADNKLVVHASSKAQKAFEMIMGVEA